MLRNVITTVYDALGLLAVAVGLGFAAGVLIGPAAVTVSGTVLLAGVRIMDWVAYPGQAPTWWRRLRKGGRRA